MGDETRESDEPAADEPDHVVGSTTAAVGGAADAEAPAVPPRVERPLRPATNVKVRDQSTRETPPARLSATDDERARDDDRDTILGHLRKNWSIFTSIIGAALAVVWYLSGVRDEVRETRHALTTRLDLLEARVQGHVDWHRTEVGVDPEPEAPDVAEEQDEGSDHDQRQPERPVRYGLLPPGEEEPTAYISGDRVLDLARRQRVGQLQPDEQTEYAQLIRWVNRETAESLGQDRLRLIAVCERQGFPSRFCRDAYRHGPFIDDALDLCLETFPRQRCLFHAAAASNVLVPALEDQSAFYVLNEDGCAVPRTEFRAILGDLATDSGHTP